ncbi:hypothetical protein QUC31_004816 [Theobroma cacao]|uniref:Desiccation-related protein PCC13-62 n=1 Tax=Theobroma cacao TaxID=3641 RepID=A0A061DQL2_THECC|nr:Uncharacterized protein TCM_004607 [Theobroma cacao]WRX08193.1 hypothetical protein QQP08_000680 [Theobroma cacao]
MASRSCLFAFLLLFLAFQSTRVKGQSLPPQCRQVPGTSAQLMQVALNMEVLRTELFLRASIGRGLNDLAPNLIPGPAPIGARIANLDNVTRRIIEELGYQGIGNIRAILGNRLVTPIQGPQLNLSRQAFSNFMNSALNTTLSPPFDPYVNTTSFLVASTFIPTAIQQYYLGILPDLANIDLRVLGASLLAIESARYGVLRTQLYLRVNATVPPYRFTVANLTERIAQLTNRLGMCGQKDEGLVVPLALGAENRTTSNIIAANVNSLLLPRTILEVFRIFFGTGNASMTGGFFPNGMNGAIAENIIRRGLV